MKKLKELRKSKYEASANSYRAEEEMKFTEEEYNIMQLHNLEETIKRAALIKMTQGEV